jgi:hypothetical protein
MDDIQKDIRFYGMKPNKALRRQIDRSSNLSGLH